MRSIPLLVVDAVDVFDKIVAAKHEPQKNLMRMARAEILAAYKAYEDMAPDVGELDIAPLTRQQKDAMQHAYSFKTKPMAMLRSNLLNRIGVARCPFCGIGESSTLDHYLPKQQYPEFSIFPKNLVPSCAVCNTRKQNRILVLRTNARMFLHPFYDQIPGAAFLIVDVRLAEGALILSYRLTRPVGVTHELFEHLKSHFNELNLADRYRRMSLEHLGERYPAFRRAYGSSKDLYRVADGLIEEAENFEQVYGSNYWCAKLYRALANNDDFCDGGFELFRSQ